MYPCELTNLICEILFLFALQNMSKSNLNEAGWLIHREKTMPVITGDATKYNCTKPYVPSVQEKGHRETEQTKIRRGV